MTIERKLAAIMFTDIAGFTALSAKDETKALNLLDTQKHILNPIFKEFNGTLHKEMGDGLLITFPTVSEAIKCGIEIQEKTKSDVDLNLRIGIHEGEVTLKNGDVLGDDVNVASRIEPFSAVGGISISGKVQQNISSLTEFNTMYIGEPKLKGVSQEVKVYCITSHGLPQTDLSKVSAKLEKESNLTKYALIGGVAILVGILFFVFQEEEEKVPSIAIIPLENKGDKTDEFYSYSISSDLISDVSSAGDIRVASLKDVEKLDYKSLTNSEIANKLFVRYISQGTLWKVDSVFQLSMELYDTKQGKVAWSNNWQKNWAELPTIKGGLSENILTNLKIKTKQNIVASGNAEAYEMYLKAKSVHEKRDNLEDIETAKGLSKKAIELDNDLIEAKILLGSIHTSLKEYDIAMEIYSSALKWAEEHSNKRWMGRSIRKMGTIYYFTDEMEKALDYQKQALRIAEEINDKWGIATCLNNLGVMALNAGNYEDALNYNNKSLAIYQEIDDRQYVAFSLRNICNIYLDKGDFDDALEYIDKSFTLYEKLGIQTGVVSSLTIKSDIYKQIGDFSKSLEIRKELVRHLEKFGDEPAAIEILRLVGWTYFTMGMFEESIKYYNLSLQKLIDLKDKQIESISLRFWTVGLGYFYNKDYDEALEYFDKSSQLQLDLKDEVNLPIKCYLLLTKKMLGIEYDLTELLKAVDEENIRNYYIDYFGLFKLLGDNSYLEKAYNDVQRKADNGMEDEFKKKFLNYPIQKQIIQEYSKAFN